MNLAYLAYLAYGAEPPPTVDSGGLSLVITAAAFMAVGALIFLSILRRLLCICRPNEMLIVAGKRHRLATGETSNFTAILAGSHWRIPFLQTVDRMDLRLIPVDLHITRVLSNGGIPLDIHAVATVKISSDERFVYNAVERFLNVPRETIWQTAKQTLEGALRDVISQLTPEQVNQDRIEFANKLLEISSEVFSKMGLQLDTLKILRVEDEAKYLINLGRTQIANALRDAENAESQANQEISQEEAAARQQAEVASKQAAIGVVQKRNQLRTVVGQLEGQAQAVEREAKVAADRARAEAEQELQGLRKELETKRLVAEVVLPADAQRVASELLAQGAAAGRLEQALAAADVMRAMAEALAAAGPQAREMYVLSQLDTLVGAVAAKVQGLQIGQIQVVDGPDCQGLQALAASYPAMVTQVLGALRELTGVDLQQVLANDGAGRPALAAARGGAQ